MAAEVFARLPSQQDGGRVLVLPLTSADGLAISNLLASADIYCGVFATMKDLCEAVGTGAGSIIVSEESVLAHSHDLLACLANQPMWSELPVIILSKPGRESHLLVELMQRLGNVSVVERPMRMSTLLSLVRSTLRARQRQYELRDFLQEREQLLESERFARGEAERAGRIKDEFLATLSHELRTPLNAVLGWTRVLRKNQAVPEEVSNGLAVIERNARSQAQIIGDLLDMSSIISGKVRLDMQPLDLATIIDATVETVRPAAEAKEIRMVVVPATNAGAMRGDAGRLQQVLWNLLANAVKFTPQGGNVTISLSRNDAQVAVEIADDGEGMDPVFVPQIFDRFRQADASSSRRHGGLGLGLSIVRQLTELHGGSVTAHSRGPGSGSTFRLVFPVAAVEVAPLEASGHWHKLEQPAEPSPDKAPVELTGVKILVVDDEPDSRALVERLLQDCGASVVTAGSAEEAILALVREVPHVIVSDIGMPGTDGYTLMRQIRALHDASASVPAIALTAYVRSEDQARAARAGFQAHLPKPVDAEALQSTVEKLARQGGRNAA
jgi:signal transduction histidine kinase/CheY-like chemotaxis protein